MVKRNVLTLLARRIKINIVIQDRALQARLYEELIVLWKYPAQSAMLYMLDISVESEKSGRSFMLLTMQA